jgi:hypothetical protein
VAEACAFLVMSQRKESAEELGSRSAAARMNTPLHRPGVKAQTDVEVDVVDWAAEVAVVV